MVDTAARRRFIGMTLAAVSAGLADRATAGGPDPSGVATTARSYLVVYRPGPNWIAGVALRGQGLGPHFEYMLGLYERGILRFAGGFGDDSGGAAVFEASDDAAARALIEADPAVLARTFAFDLRPWKLVAWADVLEARRSRAF